MRLSRELHDEVVSALGGLSAVNREAVVGYYLEGHSYAELAVLLGVPVSTVKGRLYKGRRRLAPELAPVARDVFGKESGKKEPGVMQGRTEKMVEVVVDDVLKFTAVDDGYLEPLRSGSMEELHEASASSEDWERRPGAAVILREAEGERVLPIFVGLVDGLSIWRSVAGWEPPRPFTHDLTGQMLDALGFGVENVTVLRLAEEVFYGEVMLTGGEKDAGPVRRIDSRPSDAVALATRAEAPIYATEEVFESRGYESKRAFLDARGEELGLR